MTPEEIEKHRGTKTVAVVHRNNAGPFEFDRDYGPGSLDRLINNLIATRESIPQEFRSTVSCHIESEYDSAFVSIKIAYCRPETDVEVVARIHQAREEKSLEEIRIRHKIAHLQALLAQEGVG